MKKYLCISGHEFDEQLIVKKKRGSFEYHTEHCPICDRYEFGEQSDKTVKNCSGGIHWSDSKFMIHRFTTFIGPLTSKDIVDLIK